MTQNTPGPWVAYNSDNGRILKHWRIRGDCVRDDPTFATINSNGKLSPEYEAANARLIAAAPDMLAELEAIGYDCQRYLNDDLQLDAGELCQAFLRVIDEVHRKATDEPFPEYRPDEDTEDEADVEGTGCGRGDFQRDADDCVGPAICSKRLG